MRREERARGGGGRGLDDEARVEGGVAELDVDGHPEELVEALARELRTQRELGGAVRQGDGEGAAITAQRDARRVEGDVHPAPRAVDGDVTLRVGRHAQELDPAAAGDEGDGVGEQEGGGHGVGGSFGAAGV